MQATGLILIQLDRLIIPHFLPLHDLATFGVLAAIAGSLFRVLQMGVGYSLVPRLRAAASVQERRRLVAHEARLVTGMRPGRIRGDRGCSPRWSSAGSSQGKYHLAAALVLATIVSGVVKIFNAFTKAAASALATHRELGVVNLLGWVSLAIGIGAGHRRRALGTGRCDLRRRTRLDHPRRERALHRRPPSPTSRGRSGGTARDSSVIAVADDNASWAVALFNRSVLKQEKFRRISELIEDPVGRTSLDIGADNGTISYLLRQRGRPLV